MGRTRSIIPGDESINVSGVTINADADSIIRAKHLPDSIIMSGVTIIPGAEPLIPLPHTIPRRQRHVPVQKKIPHKAGR